MQRLGAAVAKDRPHVQPEPDLLLTTPRGIAVPGARVETPPQGEGKAQRGRVCGRVVPGNAPLAGL